MLSATFGRRVEKVAESWLRDPVRIAIGRTGISSLHVTQHIISLPSPSTKLTWLISILPTLVPLGKIIIFVASRLECERILQSIRQEFSKSNQNTIQIESIHGDKHQYDRNAALRQFEKGKIQALVATDVASRGLDVKDIMTVINFDVAKNLDIHTHRIGRAGRISMSTLPDSTDSNEGEEEQYYQKGIAYTLMTRKDANFANLLMEHFVKEGREIEQELTDLARQSKYFGRSGSGNVQRKQVHGIGWDRDKLGNKSDIRAGFESNSIPCDKQPTNSKNLNYYGPSLISSNEKMRRIDPQSNQAIGKRKRML